ncbi:UNVERIFIED_CONTAM: hypothetical protein FKN15_017133 [Acipenser sinensis]
MWKAYVDYIDEMVIDGFFSSIECSLKFLLDNTDPKSGSAPLFEAQLDLHVPDMVFKPSLELGASDGLYDLVEGIINDIYRMSSLVLRLAEHSSFPHYQTVRDAVHDLERRLQKTKDNVEEMQNIMKTWVAPIFERKEGKKDSLLNLDDRQERLEKRYSAIKESGNKIHTLLKADMEDMADLADMRQFLMECVQHVMTKCCDYRNSFDHYSYLYVDDRKEFMRQFLLYGHVLTSEEIEAHAEDGVPETPPSLDQFKEQVDSYEKIYDEVNSLEPISVFDGWMKIDGRPFKCALLNVIKKWSLMFKQHLIEHVTNSLSDLEEFIKVGERGLGNKVAEGDYSGLVEVMGHLMAVKERQNNTDEMFEPLKQTIELLKTYEQELPEEVYQQLEENLELLKADPNSDMWKAYVDYIDEMVIDGFFSSIECSLKFLLDNTDPKSGSAPLFEAQLDLHVPDMVFKPSLELGASDGLYDLVEGIINDIYRMSSLVLRLAEHSSFPHYQQNLKNLKWSGNKMSLFWLYHGCFSSRFDSVNPYKMLDTAHKQISEKESDMSGIIESSGLFEVNIPDYKQLKQCRKEVFLLKELWDMITLVDSSMNDWKTTRWREINVENMDLECKRFSKEIRGLDKESRAWDAFAGLDNTVKNILTSLRAVAELQNPAIRERHWHQLMQATGVKFTMDEDTTLADLLQLNLHNFEDEVRGIVDKAVKEMGMEKVLKELNATWSSMEFQYEPHPRTKVPLLRSDEELIETLEDNQVQLQNLMTSKYIAFFLEEVSSWQQKLSTADSVIFIWFEVQRTWSHLESIFIGSEDIRSQLPEDSKRFEGIDSDFNELANDANKTPNVVQATNKPGLYEKLEDIQKRLALCEKALAEYLDTKRLAFPRFYFISSADLLDILSNGTNPQQVQRHLSKLFDNTAKMKFDTDSEGNPTKMGLGMYSKEDEYVTFNEPCDCSGQRWYTGYKRVCVSRVI